MPEFVGEVISVRQETHDVKTLRITKPKDFSFIPGQYCLVSFLDKFQNESRPFTFTTSPLVRDHFELTIKHMHDFTRELHMLRPGAKLRINGPLGDALNYDETQDSVFIAGGSGITPFMCAIRHSLAKKIKKKIMLIFSNKTEEDIIFREELDMIARRNIKIIYTLTSEVPENWKGEKGYMSKEMIGRHVKEPGKYLWYVVGPPPMMASVRQMLMEMSIPDDRIRMEEWQLPGKS